MRTNRKMTHRDVLFWANEARLDLPDRWEHIQQRLPDLQMPNRTMNDNSVSFHQHHPNTKRKRLLIAYVVLSVLILVGGLFFSGLLKQWLWPSGNPESHYTPMTTQSANNTESGKSTPSVSTYSDEQLAFSDRANSQFALMEKAQIPDRYACYAGCYIEDLRVFVILVTNEPEAFRTEYAYLLDFRIIEIRQVKYTLKELKAAYDPLYQAFSSSPNRLVDLGVVGMAVSEQNNAILIVVQDINDNVRKEVDRIIPDADMVLFEVGAES